MAQTFERAALYEEVWSTPLTKLCLKYGLSDNGVRKICKALSIPLPPAGHWAKVAAGHGTMRPPLPKHEGADTFVSRAEPNKQRRSEYASDEDAALLEQRIQFESSPACAVLFSPEVTRWHPAVAPFQHALVERARKHAQDLAERERYLAARAKQPHAQPEVLRSQWHNLDQGLLFDPHGGAVCFRVSIATYKRALAIANALALAAARRGFQVNGDAGRERLEFGLEGQFFSVALRERHSQSSGLRVPANKLSLVTFSFGMSEWQIVDDAKPLEDQLGRIFPRWYRAVVHARELEREAEAHQARRPRYRAEAQAFAEQRAAEEAAQLVAVAREEKLVQEAGRWHQVAQLRAYASAVSSSGLADGAWQQWAQSVAEKLDPLLDPSSTFRDQGST